MHACAHAEYSIGLGRMMNDTYRSMKNCVGYLIQYSSNYVKAIGLRFLLSALILILSH